MHTSTPLTHIAFIMDGNRRWAKKRVLPTILGHTEGAKTLKKIAKRVKKLGIPYMTVYALSTENLARPEKELTHLFSLIHDLANQLHELIEDDVRICVIGNMSLLPSEVASSLHALEEQTLAHSSLTLTLAIAYGGRDEIVRAVHAAKEQNNEINEASFGTLLDTGCMPDVDLIVRTGGHQRLSNFLLWSSAYTELFFSDTLWPAFTESELGDILAWYARQEKNSGK